MGIGTLRYRTQSRLPGASFQMHSSARFGECCANSHHLSHDMPIRIHIGV